MSESSIKVPTISEILKTGLQFGHNSARWNPLMEKYIYTNKNDIHIVDVVKTRALLVEAAEFLKEMAGKGEIIFVGTKRQAAGFVQDEAVRAGAHFVANRWPGGLLTNFDVIKKSIYKLRRLEQMFDEGIEGRTKYEVTRMKVEWSRLFRLYGGVKQIEKLPVAAVVVDPRFEKVAVRECRKLGIPIVALTDTNCNPKTVDYVIPGNDDALKAISLVLGVLADAVLAGNGGKGVQHDFKDYSQVEVKLIKSTDGSKDAGEQEDLAADIATEQPAVVVRAPAKRRSSKNQSAGKGILGAVKEEADAKAKAAKKSTENKKKK